MSFESWVALSALAASGFAVMVYRAMGRSERGAVAWVVGITAVVAAGAAAAEMLLAGGPF